VQLSVINVTLTYETGIVRFANTCRFSKFHNRIRF